MTSLSVTDNSDEHQHDYPNFTRIPWAVLESPGLSNNAKLLFGFLDKYAGKNGQAFPSRKTLATDMNSSLRTVDSAVKELVSAGFLIVQHNFAKDSGLQRSSNYFPKPYGFTEDKVPDESSAQNQLHPDETGGAESAIPGLAETAHQVRKMSYTRGAKSATPGIAETAHLNKNHISRTSEEELVNEELGKKNHGNPADSSVVCVDSFPDIKEISSSSAEEVGDRDSDESIHQSKPLRDFSDSPVVKQKKSKASGQNTSLSDSLAKADPVIVRDLFDAWASTGNGKSQSTDDRLGYIARALVEWNFSPEDVWDALNGWENDAWERRPQFKDISYLLGSVEDVEKFRDLKRNPHREVLFSAHRSYSKKANPYVVSDPDHPKPDQPKPDPSVQSLVDRIHGISKEDPLP